MDYERSCLNCSGGPVNRKKEVWLEVIKEIEARLSNGEGVEISYVRDRMNEKITSGNITNQRVK